MEAANQFIDNILSDKDEMSVAKLGEVVSYDSSSNTAEIQPLPSSDNDIAINVPVLVFRSSDFYIYNPLQAGDLVLLVYIDNDIDNILQGQDGVNSDSKHQDSDLVCIGGISRLNDPLNVPVEDSIVISNIEGSGSISISPSGDITIKGDNIDITANQVNIDKG